MKMKCTIVVAGETRIPVLTDNGDFLDNSHGYINDTSCKRI